MHFVYLQMYLQLHLVEPYRTTHVQYCSIACYVIPCGAGVSRKAADPDMRFGADP